jgi:hypothetical protein
MTLEELLAREGIRKTIHGYNAAGDARDGEAKARAGARRRSQRRAVP